MRQEKRSRTATLLSPSSRSASPRRPQANASNWSHSGPPVTTCPPRTYGRACAYTAPSSSGYSPRSDDDGLVFISPEGAPLWRSSLCRRVWRPALRAVGLPVIHFDDLRHRRGDAIGTTARLLEPEAR